MEKFSRRATAREEDLVPALHNAIREDKIFPVIFSSGLATFGADRSWISSSTTPGAFRARVVQGEVAAGGNGDAPKRHE